MFFVFFFKQKTAYEMRISDWSSDVCSSDLRYIQSQDNIGIRGQLLWRPADNLDITLAGDWNRQEAVCCGSVFVRTGETQRPLNRQFAALAAAQGYAFPSDDPYDRLSDLDAALNAGNEIGGASLRVNWDVGPGPLTRSEERRVGKKGVRTCRSR